MLISNWYYGTVPSDPVAYSQNRSLSMYQKLGEWGYDQVPTSSTYGYHLSTKLTMKFFKEHVNMDTTAGFMTSPWLATTPKYKYMLLNDAFVFGNARRSVFPED